MTMLLEPMPRFNGFSDPLMRPMGGGSSSGGGGSSSNGLNHYHHQQYNPAEGSLEDDFSSSRGLHQAHVGGSVFNAVNDHQNYPMFGQPAGSMAPRIGPMAHPQGTHHVAPASVRFPHPDAINNSNHPGSDVSGSNSVVDDPLPGNSTYSIGAEAPLHRGSVPWPPNAGSHADMMTSPTMMQGHHSNMSTSLPTHLHHLPPISSGSPVEVVPSELMGSGPSPPQYALQQGGWAAPFGGHAMLSEQQQGGGMHPYHGRSSFAAAGQIAGHPPLSSQGNVSPQSPPYPPFGMSGPSSDPRGSDVGFALDGTGFHGDDGYYHSSSGGGRSLSYINPFEVKHRRRTTKSQFRVLEDTFSKTPKPSAEVRKSISEQLDMPPRAVQIWFQNRRAKAKTAAKKAVAAAIADSDRKMKLHTNDQEPGSSRPADAKAASSSASTRAATSSSVNPAATLTTTASRPHIQRGISGPSAISLSGLAISTDGSDFQQRASTSTSAPAPSLFFGSDSWASSGSGNVAGEERPGGFDAESRRLSWPYDHHHHQYQKQQQQQPHHQHQHLHQPASNPYPTAGLPQGFTPAWQQGHLHGSSESLTGGLNANAAEASLLQHHDTAAAAFAPANDASTASSGLAVVFGDEHHRPSTAGAGNTSSWH